MRSLMGRTLFEAFAIGTLLLHAQEKTEHRMFFDSEGGMGDPTRSLTDTLEYDCGPDPEVSPWSGSGRVGKGQRKANRRDRWRGPQGSRRW